MSLSDKHVTMSDAMASQRITVRIPQSLGRRLKKQASLKGRSESDMVRDALERYLAQTPAGISAYDLARRAGFIGCARGGPRDLSTNRKYFEGFGRDK